MFDLLQHPDIVGFAADEEEIYRMCEGVKPLLACWKRIPEFLPSYINRFREKYLNEYPNTTKL